MDPVFRSAHFTPFAGSPQCAFMLDRWGRSLLDLIGTPQELHCEHSLIKSVNFSLLTPSVIFNIVCYNPLMPIGTLGKSDNDIANGD
jgi:hypothetical protein